jgi:KaiC/GvpD/RAD55 family RecA-like ATPase
MTRDAFPPRIPATELMVADLPERKAILDPILATKSLALLYGPRGLGKTFVAMGIAWAAASGTTFLDWRAHRPHRVVYVDGEMAAVDMKARLRLFGAVPSTLDFILADMHAASPPDIGRLEGQRRLMEAWGQPDLVVLDNLSSLAGFEAGDPDRWSELQRFLMLQRRFGRAMLLVHHANKKGLQRGTNRREDVLDVVMAMRRPADYAPRQGARFEIHFDKARGLHGNAVDPIEARLETDASGVAHWSWHPAQEALLQRAAALLNDGLNASRMAVQLGISRGHGYRLRDRALERGLLS